METNTEVALPEGAQMGSDGRPHHESGFSFVGTLEQCPAARRSEVSAASLVAAGERGVMLHGILEDAVKRWVSLCEQGKSPDFVKVVQEGCRGLHPNDSKSVMKIANEIRVFFVPDMQGLLVGTEERLEVRDPRTKKVVSFGWYDILVILGENALIVDHKFVRKEVEAAEKNRQGHCLAVGVFQEYEQVKSATVLFAMPECESSTHTFSRVRDFERLETEVITILEAREKPFKTLKAGEHCVYCKFRGDCPATISALKTAVTAIEPMSVPSTFDVIHVKTPAQMALLRYWVSVLEPVAKEIKIASTEMAKSGVELKAQLGPETLEYKLSTRRSPRKLTEAIDVWNAVKEWMPAECFITACGTSITALEAVTVQLLADRLLAQGKEPNPTQIAKDFTEMLMTKQLLTREEGVIYQLRRKKVQNSILSGGGKRKALPSGEDAED